MHSLRSIESTALFIGLALLAGACTIDEEPVDPEVSERRCIDCGGAGEDPPTTTRLAQCGNLCDDNAACSAPCQDGIGGATTTCETSVCRRYDVYCAYPVITRATVSNKNEWGLGGPFAYMYFGSVGEWANKSGTYASSIGGHYYNPSEAWASNFRGPWPVYGESGRPQWEWWDGGLDASFATGTPYLYGQKCVSVAAGVPAPTLAPRSDTVYEDDECILGICNPDDYVGGFTMDLAQCSGVFGSATTGWTAERDASVGGDLSRLSYKVWCYSCREQSSPACSAGVVQ